MLTAVPKHWYSWNFTLKDGESTLAEIDLSNWRERGTLIVWGEKYRIYRDGLLGPFLLESNGLVLARAEKPSAFRRAFIVSYNGREYELRAKRFGRRFVLFSGSEEIGSVTPEGMWTRRAQVDLPDDLSDRVKGFIIWLTLVIWKRDQDGGS